MENFVLGLLILFGCILIIVLVMIARFYKLKKGDIVKRKSINNSDSTIHKSKKQAKAKHEVINHSDINSQRSNLVKKDSKDSHIISIKQHRILNKLIENFDNKISLKQSN